MNYHKLLERQLKKYLGDAYREDERLQKFIAAVNDSYAAYERDKELWTHAFSISEKEYHEVNDNLLRESNQKKQSLEKLKDTIAQIDGSQVMISDESDDLVMISEYLNQQIIQRKAVEASLSETAQLLTTLVANLNSGVLMEDEYRNIRYINQQFCTMFNIPASPESMIGMDCTHAADQSKHLFKHPQQFVKRINTLLEKKELIPSDELALADGRFFERSYIPIFVDQVYKGHLWKYNDITQRKQNELRLKENQIELERLSLVASANANGVLLTDASGRIFWSNEGYLNLTGYSMEELMGKWPTHVASGPLSDRAQIRQMIEAYMQGKTFSLEVAYYRKDGTWFWGRVKGQPILNYEGKVTQYFSIIEDITQAKEHEQQIQRLSLVASANAKGVIILNNDLSIQWVNPAYTTITGYSEQELIGRNPAHLFMAKADDPQLLMRMRERDALGENFTEEFLHLRKDGSSFWARLNMQFVTNEAGNVTHRSGVLEDITKEKDAENILRIREEKYRNIIANMNLGLLEVDNEDYIQYANQSFCEMSGYEAQELIGKKAGETFIHGDNLDLVSAKNMRRQRGESDAYELPVRNKRGELKYWLISGAPRINDHGETIGSIGIHLDITQQKKQEIELIEARKKAEESSRAKEEFLANMSHEIRTPLNAIIGMLRELGKDPLPARQKSYLNNADTASRHLLSIINNILDMSKIEAGEFHLENRHFSLRDVINETVTIISNNAHEKLLKLHIKITPTLEPAQIGDPARIRQILINILGNSIKFTERGSITIDCIVTDTNDFMQQVQITITDTGIGMDEAYLRQHNLFKKFSQEDKSTARKYGGTGLGMAITYELVQLMGGKVEVSSTKGKGTAVKLLFPLKTGQAEQVETSATLYNVEELKGVKVLLVEDNEMNRLVAINTLSYFGVDITEAENGKIALDKLKQTSFDMILMDLHMPEMDGLETTRYIRNELKSNVPIIALTANALKKEIDLCMEAGMNGYVTKPFEENVLLATILKRTGLPGMQASSGSSSPGTAPAPGYDLDNLKTVSRGNMDFVKKMVALFISQSALSAEQLKQALADNNAVAIHETAHRLKPSIDNMGVNALRETIREIERLGRDEPESEQLPSLIAHLDEVIRTVSAQLRSEFPDLQLP